MDKLPSLEGCEDHEAANRGRPLYGRFRGEGGRRPHSISGDHTALADARIPSFIVIDFEYGPSCNTTQDPVDKYSAQSFVSVDAHCYKFLYLP